MKTIAFMTAKGGVGKTTLAASVAVAAQEAGEDVFMLDLDPQASLRGWRQRREADTPPVDTTTADKLPQALESIAGGEYSLVVIDTQGTDTATTAAAMRVADLSLIPARPSLLDIGASRPTMAALSRLGRPYAFVLNQCPPRSGRSQDAGRALSLLGVLAQPFIAQRADHLDAVALGLGVTELDASGKAAEEMRQLWSWIAKRLRSENG